MQLHLFFALPLLVFADNPVSRPAIIPPFDLQGTIEKGLQEHLTSSKWSISYWNKSMLPLGCNQIADQYLTNIANLEVFQVQYDDCSQPWVMCRHKDAKTDANTMAETFGKIPLGMREYVKNIAVLKPYKLMNSYAVSYNDTIAVADDSFFLYAIAQEMMHSIDSHFSVTNITADNGTTSESDIWKAYHDKSDAVVSNLSAFTWQDNLAETGVISLYDIVVPGSLQAIQPNWTQVFPQYALLQTLYRNILSPGTKTNCTNRLEESLVLYKNYTAMHIPVPNSNGIEKILPSVLGNNTFRLIRYDWNGSMATWDGD
ncbi:hypothetical protein F4776DRAFT_656962 [Hypoxylon sp. NC0597]|nr:hypothetical protein F4776DRAFT_656962 [Hypoxylon sp. NC0597]